MKERLVGRLPTHAGAVIIAIVGLFFGILLAQGVVRAIGFQGGGALALELVVLAATIAGIWIALPDRFFTPWKGFFSGDPVEPWESPTDRRRREDAEQAERDAQAAARGDRAAGRHGDPRDDPPGR